MTQAMEPLPVDVAEVGLANPQMPTSTPGSPDGEVQEMAKFNENKSAVTKEQLPNWEYLKEGPQFKIGIIVDSFSTNDRHIYAIAKPATPCSLSWVVILNAGAEGAREASMNDWLTKNGMQKEASNITVGRGKEGLTEMFASDINAVYIIVPPGSQRDYVLEALKAGKHVLLNDPVSTSMSEFVEQQNLAKQYGKFIQFSTMFVHQFQVLRFIEKVLGDEEFGWIHRIDATLHLCYDDVEKVGVKLPLRAGDGSIRVLGRFCVLVSTLFYSQVGSKAQSAKVETLEYGDNGEIIKSTCTVKFTEGRILRFTAGYTHSATRQLIQLDAHSRFATMNDFVIEHPDGLATYRVYQKAPNVMEHIEVTTGEAIDLAGGPPQNTMMWRTFVRLCDSLDRQGGWDQSEVTRECRVLANVALQTKRILIALMKSAEQSFQEVVIDDIDYQ